MNTRVNNKCQKYKKTGISVWRHIILLVFMILTVLYAYKNVMGYQWVIDTLIGKNLDYIKQHKDLTLEQKFEAKMGANARYLNYVKNHTPDTAIILMPPKDIILKDKDKTRFDKYLTNKIWVTNYLYPRKVIYFDEAETSELYTKVSHIAVINYWGHSLAEGNNTKKSPYTVLKKNN
jgi:hypothetical protein